MEAARAVRVTALPPGDVRSLTQCRLENRKAKAVSASLNVRNFSEQLNILDGKM
jgi:hypothetical protein